MTNYPAALDTNLTLYVAVNNKATTLVAPLSPTNIDIAILDDSSIQATDGLVSIGDEVVKYSFIDNAGPNPILRNCLRGYDGTAAAAHPAGRRVEIRWVATHHNGLADAVIAIQTQLGVDPAAALFYGNLANRLSLNLPLVIPIALSADWSFTHNRRRLVSIQLWRNTTGDKYEMFTSNIEQQLNPIGVAAVSILLGTGNDKEGFLVVQ